MSENVRFNDPYSLVLKTIDEAIEVTPELIYIM